MPSGQNFKHDNRVLLRRQMSPKVVVVMPHRNGKRKKACASKRPRKGDYLRLRVFADVRRGLSDKVLKYNRLDSVRFRMMPTS